MNWSMLSVCLLSYGCLREVERAWVAWGAATYLDTQTSVSQELLKTSEMPKQWEISVVRLLFGWQLFSILTLWQSYPWWVQAFFLRSECYFYFTDITQILLEQSGSGRWMIQTWLLMALWRIIATWLNSSEVCCMSKQWDVHVACDQGL